MSANPLDAWSLHPLDHAAEIADYFSGPRDKANAYAYQTNSGFLDFLAQINSPQQEALRPLCENLPGHLLFIGALHDDQDIAECSRAMLVGVDGLQTFAQLEKPKLSLKDVVDLVSLACAHPRLSDHLRKAISDYKIHDPDENQISSGLKKMGGIKAARLLYFAVPAPKTWQEMDACLSEATESNIADAWGRFAYEAPAYARFSWHIQSTVVRILLLTSSFRQQEENLSTWKEFCSNKNSTLGHDGKASGFNNESLKMIEELNRSSKWKELRANQPSI